MTLELGFINYGGEIDKLTEIMKLANEQNIRDFMYEPCGKSESFDTDWWYYDNENRKEFKYDNYILYTGDRKIDMDYRYILYIVWDECTVSTFILF